VIPTPTPADQGRLPLVRVRHPCRDAAEFHARFAGAITAGGVFVPTSGTRPVGSRVELVLELRDGTAVRGEALAVDSAEQGGGPGLTFRFVRLFEGSLQLEPPAAAERAAVAPGAAGPALTPSSFEELFTPAEREELLRRGAVVEEGPAGVETEQTIDVPLRRDVLEVRDATDDTERQRAARIRGRRVRYAAAGVAALVVVGAATYRLVAGEAERSVAAHLAAADARLAEGRIAGGGDAALDHLVAARGLDAADPAVRERLRLVADKLEQLADLALARGDFAEAAVHLTAATQAAPDRKRLHVRLGQIARTRGRAQGEPSAPGADHGTGPSTGLRTSARPQ
jgi:hypothetical protein